METSTPLTETTQIADEEMVAAMADLLYSSKWMKFMAITGFVFLGLFALLSLTVLAIPRGGVIFGILAVLLTVLFFPMLFLYRYAEGIQQYHKTSHPETLETAFENQRKHWLFYCIFILIFFALGVLATLFGAEYLQTLKQIR